MLQNHILLTQSPTPTNRSPHPYPAKATAPPVKRSLNDRPASAPLPLSEREQQVCEYLSQGFTFEAIARHLNCSPAAARAYHRRALAKHQRTIALASLEQGESYATANPEPALEELPRNRRVSVRRSRPNPLELLVPSLFVTGESVTTGQKLSTQRSPNPQTTITDRPPRHPSHQRNRRPSRRAGVGFRMAAAS